MLLEIETEREFEDMEEPMDLEDRLAVVLCDGVLTIAGDDEDDEED